MISEWMKVMLEEISRKKTEAEQAGAEEERRRVPASAPLPSPGSSIRTQEDKPTRSRTG